MVAPSEATRRIRECLSYYTDGPYIVIRNECGESFLLDAVEVRYYITVRTEESVTEVSTGRREISERLSVGKRVSPGGSVEIYFGPVENIVEVYAIAEYAGGKYKVMLRQRRLAEEEEGGQQ